MFMDGKDGMAESRAPSPPPIPFTGKTVQRRQRMSYDVHVEVRGHPVELAFFFLHVSPGN